jgi:hypothetical protein
MLSPICFKLDKQLARRALSRALANTGKRIAASKLIIATTTRSSIRVNPLDVELALHILTVWHPITLDMRVSFKSTFKVN